MVARLRASEDGKPFAIEGSPVNLGIAVDVEKKDGSHSLMVPAIKGADGLDFAGFHSYYEELIAKTRENKLSADDFQGTNICLTNPGGIGTIASVPRLLSGQSAIIATGSIAYPPEWTHASPERIKQLGVSQGDDADLDLRPPRHPGRRVGRLPAPDRAAAAGRGRLLRGGRRRPRLRGRPPSAAAHPASASAPPLSAAAPSAEPTTAPAQIDEELLQAVQAATSLLKAYRTHGHLAAQLDPLGSEPKGDPALQPENVNLTPELMARIPASILRIGVPGETLLEALPRMRDAYCGTIGYQFEHLSSHQQRIWLREMIETGAHRQPLADEEKKRLLDRLIDVFQFERFLEKAYLGPEDVLDRGARRGRADARRSRHPLPARRRRGGRLRDGPPRPPQRPRPQPRPLGRVDPRRVRGLEADRRGQGGRRDPPRRHRRRQVPLRPPRGLRDRRRREDLGPPLPEPEPPRVRRPGRHRRHPLPPAGLRRARARPTTRSGRCRCCCTATPPSPAQGVVAETLNLQALPGYTTGGTIHVIQNNQVGFTTDPDEARSTPYAADMAKGFNVPIIHVNADDVEACVAAVRLAMAYRERWCRDIVIDVIGYRRFGHNETDEPAYTQPTMAAKIKSHPPVSEIYAEKLIDEGTVSRRGGRQGLRRAPRRDVGGAEGPAARRWRRASTRTRPSPAPPPAPANCSTAPPARRSHTAVEAEKLRALNEALLKTPEGFNVHRKLRRPLARRIEALERGRDRLRPGRGARLRLAADRRRPHPPHRPGHRARHLLPPPPRPPRREHRPRVHADAAPRGRHRAVRALQQPALGDRLPRLRVRLLGGEPERAGPLGGAVRRLRQRRPGDHRQLHRLRRVEVGADQPPDAAAAARLRGLGPGALERPDRALPRPRRRGQHPHRQPDHRRPVLPPAAPPGADQASRGR